MAFSKSVISKSNIEDGIVWFRAYIRNNYGDTYTYISLSKPKRIINLPNLILCFNLSSLSRSFCRCCSCRSLIRLISQDVSIPWWRSTWVTRMMLWLDWADGTKLKGWEQVLVDRNVKMRYVYPFRTGRDDSWDLLWIPSFMKSWKPAHWLFRNADSHQLLLCFASLSIHT